MNPLSAHLHAMGLLLWAAQSLSEDGAPPDPKDPPGTERRFFQRTIDFWKTGPRKEALPPGTESALERTRETIWAEPIRQPDGRTSIYVPPKAVLDFLENPTPENLKGYLDWKRARAEKLRRAMELLEEYRASEDAEKTKGESSTGTPAGLAGTDVPPAPPVQVARPADDHGKRTSSPQSRDPKAVQVTYFHGKGCPHCTKQDRFLADWLARHPEASVRVLELGESPELWLRHRIRGTPSLLLEARESEHGVLLEGLSDPTRLDQGLGDLQRQGKGTTEPLLPKDGALPGNSRK
jgi:hypothetical protein